MTLLKHMTLGIIGVCGLWGCVSAVDLGGGRYMVPEVAEVRSPFGTNGAFMRIQSCDGIDDTTGFHPIWGTYLTYRNCKPESEWVPIYSQGQGGQILQGLMMGAGIGTGAALSGGGASASASSTVGTAATHGHK